MADIAERLRYAAVNALGPGGLTSPLVEEAAKEIERLRASSEWARRLNFNTGYLIACCNLTNMHNEPGMASDVLAAAGITQTDVRAMDLTEYDARALAKIRTARRDDPLS